MTSETVLPTEEKRNRAALSTEENGAILCAGIKAATDQAVSVPVSVPESRGATADGPSPAADAPPPQRKRRRRWGDAPAPATAALQVAASPSLAEVHKAAIQAVAAAQQSVAPQQGVAGQQVQPGATSTGTPACATRLRVSNLGELSDEIIKGKFEAFGAVATVVRQPDSSLLVGYGGSMEADIVDSCEKAIAAMNNVDVDGQTLQVSVYSPSASTTGVGVAAVLAQAQAKANQALQQQQQQPAQMSMGQMPMGQMPMGQMPMGGVGAALASAQMRANAQLQMQMQNQLQQRAQMLAMQAQAQVHTLIMAHVSGRPFYCI